MVGIFRSKVGFCLYSQANLPKWAFQKLAWTRIKLELSCRAIFPFSVCFHLQCLQDIIASCLFTQLSVIFCYVPSWKLCLSRFGPLFSCWQFTPSVVTSSLSFFTFTHIQYIYTHSLKAFWFQSIIILVFFKSMGVRTSEWFLMFSFKIVHIYSTCNYIMQTDCFYYSIFTSFRICIWAVLVLLLSNLILSLLVSII